MKRENYISWDELFIGIAELASKRSKDPSTQHGSCIVMNDKVLSIGYNGLPRGCDDDGVDDISILPPTFKYNGLHYDYWEKPQKYEFACHSEENAIINARTNLRGSTLYLYSEKGYYPCSTCARMIVQSGIEYLVMKTATTESTDVYNWDFSKHILKQGNVHIKILEPS